ncbi:TM2 domain-containing membrane protein YozV [Gracilibacillus halotolerans]|uniref:TM2 domain-containing membrane protein YozV n=1 Tax=Gracilibacillus halotolerans TaxID=74386 RepID=A0A841RME2_9BACI|nr:NINE protein [Gracilibacillus halotolerans]MBB6512793.1 TM2 domain-containing membrane protein YozV [Gracilibacillus halotolerans]
MVNQKSIAVAYILWFFFGMLGIHRFYTGRTGTGIVQLLLSLFGWATTFLIIGWFILPIVGIWLFIDIFLIPGLCRNPR